ncbi:MAG TPA: nucleotidyltransferase [Terriglobales bacterium]
MGLTYRSASQRCAFPELRCARGKGGAGELAAHLPAQPLPLEAHAPLQLPRTKQHPRLVPEHAPKSPESSSTTSARPGTLPPEAASFYREVLRAMNDHGLPYAVAGAFALEKYTGIWRLTKDLDLFLKPDDVPRALDYLRAQNFHCETPDPVWLSKAFRGEYFVDLISGMSNAAMVVDDSWLGRTQPATIAGVESQILSPEDLLASKLFVTRRERFDGADIAHIIYRTQGKLQWERILELTGEHWEMLLWALILFRYVYPAHSDFVPSRLWQDLLSRYGKLVQTHDPQAPFRGSLVDENIFSIDMKDWGLEDIQSMYRARHLRKHATCVATAPHSARKAGNE